MPPVQVLEVRFEADTPDDAIDVVVEQLLQPGLDVVWIREEL